MKEIKAFIHRNRVSDVLHALKNADFYSATCNLSVIDVAGTLQALDRKEQGYSIELGEGFVSEVKLELICEDEHAAEAISLICKNAQTGQPLAGRIYVIDVVESIPIEKE